MKPKILLLLLSMLVVPLVAHAQEAERPSLSGTWLINQEESETMREKIGEMLQQQDLNPRARSRWERVQTRGRMSLQNQPFGRLKIDHAEPRVAIEYRSGRLRELYTDGRELEPDEAVGETAVTVTWQGPRLIVDAETVRGRVTEFWDLSDDGERLFVTTQAEMGERFEGPVTFRRVYDREPAPAESESTESEDTG